MAWPNAMTSCERNHIGLLFQKTIDDRACHCHPNETSKLTRKLSIGPHHAILHLEIEGPCVIVFNTSHHTSMDMQSEKQPS